MDYKLTYLPERPSKPRDYGQTMMMDKGLSTSETFAFCEAAADFTDFVKFGFGTALITKNLDEKIKIYREAGIRPYFGGTLFEMFIVRDKFDDFCKLVDQYKLDLVEISDGSIALEHDVKLACIHKLKNQVTVITEVGSKQKGVLIPPDQWVEMMKTELDAGAWKVIAEARETGTIGIYQNDGSANTELIDDIIMHIPPENIIWEAPVKNQQVWFIKMLGANVNLGNIAPLEMVALEALRLGMRGDTFFDFLPKEYEKFKQQ